MAALAVRNRFTGMLPKRKLVAGGNKHAYAVLEKTSIPTKRLPTGA